MTHSRVHYSSESQTWETPADFYAKVHAEFRPTLDVCANQANAKCRRFFTTVEDGLKQKWRGTCWMNPPYGRGIGAWVRKAYESAQEGAVVVCLLPARTDTAWWHDFVAKAEEVRFIRGRLKFSGHKNAAPFPCALVVFGKRQP